jgi:hypothetical protein
MALDTTTPRTRRALLAGVGGAVAALAAQAIGRPIPVAAATVQLGQLNTETAPTTFRNTKASASAVALRGRTSYTGPASGSVGVDGISSGVNGTGVKGTANKGAVAYGVWGSSTAGYGVVGTGNTGVAGTGATGVEGSGDTAVSASGGTYGVDASQSADVGTAVNAVANGENGNGVVGSADNGAIAYGVWGMSTSGYAGVFSGNVSIVGTLTKTAGSFLIDHPLAPATRYLAHSFVESPDMMNVYNGNVVTGADGRAVVRLPRYFGALNRDFRYQLTVIGSMARATVEREIARNRFTIRTDEPGVKVSWQVTGIRKDAYATAHPIIVEQDKPARERGTYLHPAVHDKPASRGIHHDRMRALRRARPAQTAPKTATSTM